MNLLFFTSDNSPTAQMAEGWACRLLGGSHQIWRSSPKAHSLDPLALRAMQEVGIDITLNFGVHWERVQWDKVDLIVRFDPGDPLPSFALDISSQTWSYALPPCFEGTEQEKMEHYREIRDALELVIQRFSVYLPGVLEMKSKKCIQSPHGSDFPFT